MNEFLWFNLKNFDFFDSMEGDNWKLYFCLYTQLRSCRNIKADFPWSSIFVSIFHRFICFYLILAKIFAFSCVLLSRSMRPAAFNRITSYFICEIISHLVTTIRKPIASCGLPTHPLQYISKPITFALVNWLLTFRLNRKRKNENLLPNIRSLSHYQYMIVIVWVVIFRERTVHEQW